MNRKILDIITRKANITLDAVSLMPVSLVDEDFKKSVLGEFRSYCAGVMSCATALGEVCPLERGAYDDCIMGARTIITSAIDDRMRGIE